MYKIVTKMLVQSCKDDAQLGKLVEMLPLTDQAFNKRKGDIAFSLEYLREFNNDEAKGKAIRDTFVKSERTSTIHAVVKKSKAKLSKLIPKRNSNEVEKTTIAYVDPNIRHH